MTQFTTKVADMAVKIALPVALAWTSIAVATPPEPRIGGKWSAKQDFGATAVNMALMPYDSVGAPSASRIVWYNDDNFDEHGAPLLKSGAWTWTPPSDAAMAAGAWPSTMDAHGEITDLNYHIFCSGMGLLPSGDLMIAGGTKELENGDEHADILNRRDLSVIHKVMNFPRWYGSVTALPDGHALVSSGSLHKECYRMGGRPDGDRLLYRLPVGSTFATWDGASQPTFTQSTGGPLSMDAQRGQSVVSTPTGDIIYYGGQNAAGLTSYNSVWYLYSTGSPTDQDVSYILNAKVADPSVPAPNLSFHSMAVATSPQSTAWTALIYGGQTVTSSGGSTTTTPQSEMYGFTFNASPDKLNIQWTPRLAQVGQDIPKDSNGDRLPRVGHMCYWDKNINRFVLFGGATSLTSEPTDNDVYSLELTNGNSTVSWKKMSVIGALKPTPRMLMASADIYPSKLGGSNNISALGGVHEIVMYGGRTHATGTASDELWIMQVVDADHIRWINPSNTFASAGTQRPIALEMAGATATTNGEEFLLSGGRTGPSDATGRLETWAISVYDTTRVDLGTIAYFPDGGDTGGGSGNGGGGWQRRADAPSAAFGHTIRFDNRDLFTRTPEVFDPVAGSFTPLSTGGRLQQDWFPHMFVLPSSVAGAPAAGNWDIFFAGPSDPLDQNSTQGVSRRLSVGPRAIPGVGGVDATWSSSYATSLRGGSTVEYLPGKFLKCGSRDTDTDKVGISTSGITEYIDFTSSANPSPQQWTAVPSANQMQRRVNHNLTVLPTGQVLVTGGMQTFGNELNALPQSVPEIWDPATHSFDPTFPKLAENPIFRGYHSSTLLLLDARVLSSGGNFTETLPPPHTNDQHYGDIYSPPYLFDSQNNPALRPTISAMQRSAGYGEAVPVTFDNANGASTTISSVVLIAPGMSTHGYDENQRLVPLSFTQSGATVTAAIPADPTVAPPGEYMFFALNSSGVPCVAWWLRIELRPATLSAFMHECISDPSNVGVYWTPPLADAHLPANVASGAYDMRYRLNTPVTSGNFSTATVLPNAPVPTPQSAGWQSWNLQNLPAGSHVFVGARSTKTGSGWSAVANVLDFYTYLEDCGGAGGGGGGGGGFLEGASAHRGSSGAFYLQKSGGGGDSLRYDENTLLPNAPTDLIRTDRIALPFGPVWTDSSARVRITRTGRRGTRLDQVRLIEVNHPAGEQVFLRGTELVGGTLSDPVRVSREDGSLVVLQPDSSVAFSGNLGDTLEVDLGIGPATLALQARHAHLVIPPDSTGVLVQSLAGSAWVRCGHLEVRDRSATQLFDVPNGNRVRLIFLADHTLERVARFVPGAGVTTSIHSATHVDHSVIGDVTSQIQESGVIVASGAHIYADFGGLAPGDPDTQDWFLEVTGAHTMLGVSGIAHAQATGRDGTPGARLALENARPNPFSSQTSVQFSLPSRASARLEVFDLSGRRIGVLASGTFDAGVHVIPFDRHDAKGSRLPAGVYLYRLSTLGSRLERKFVLLP